MRGSRGSGVCAWGAVTVLLGCLALATCQARGQCVGGVCTAPRYQSEPPVVYGAAPRLPRAAWRYESATGHRAAVVRIKTADRDGRQSVGSGVLVRWGKRIVVLTARHVVKDAVKVWVWLHRGRWYEGRVLKADTTWDVAVLDIGSPPEAQAVELAFGEAAHPKPGDSLESCGYGPDGQLAVNTGQFLGYRTTGRGGPADWLALSGQARSGDSGGPVFNAAGHVVGVLWGTDGEEVVGAQAGRLHLVLNEACGPSRGAEPSEQVVAASPPAVKLRPEAAEAGTVEVALGAAQPSCLPLLRPRVPPPAAPAPQVIVQSDVEARTALQRIDGKMDLIIRNTSPPPQAPAKDNERLNPLLALLVVGAAVVAGFVVYFAAQKG